MVQVLSRLVFNRLKIVKMPGMLAHLVWHSKRLVRPPQMTLRDFKTCLAKVRVKLEGLGKRKKYLIAKTLALICE